jgi:peroxiredoxin
VIPRVLIPLGLILFAAAAIAAEVPRPAPEFAIHLIDGKQILLSQFRGKVVALEFLQTTCPHCQNCSVLLNRLYKEYGPRGFQPLGVAFNEMATLLVPDYIRQFQLTFPVGVAARDQVIDFLQYPPARIMYVPQLVFIDRKGIIRAYYPGNDKFFENEEPNMRAEIEALLKEPVKRGSAAGASHAARRAVK